MAPPIRLALVDDHRMILSGLAEWIRSAADDIVVSFDWLTAPPEAK